MLGLARSSQQGLYPAQLQAMQLLAAIKLVAPVAQPSPPRMTFLWAVACLALASTVSGKSFDGCGEVLGVQQDRGTPGMVT